MYLFYDIVIEDNTIKEFYFCSSSDPGIGYRYSSRFESAPTFSIYSLSGNSIEGLIEQRCYGDLNLMSFLQEFVNKINESEYIVSFNIMESINCIAKYFSDYMFKPEKVLNKISLKGQLFNYVYSHNKERLNLPNFSSLYYCLFNTYPSYDNFSMNGYEIEKAFNFMMENKIIKTN